MRPSRYRGTSLIRNRASLAPYSRIMPRALWWPYGGGLFLMSEVPLYGLGRGELEGAFRRSAAERETAPPPVGPP